jgi:hypothetical protein
MLSDIGRCACPAHMRKWTNQKFQLEAYPAYYYYTSIAMCHLFVA